MRGLDDEGRGRQIALPDIERDHAGPAAAAAHHLDDAASGRSERLGPDMRIHDGRSGGGDRAVPIAAGRAQPRLSAEPALRSGQRETGAGSTTGCAPGGAFARMSRISLRSLTSAGTLRRRLGLGLLLLLQPVHRADDQEEDERHDHEIDGDRQEVAVAEHGPGLLGVGIGHALLDRGRQGDVIVRKIEPAGHRADDGHEDVAHH